MAAGINAASVLAQEARALLTRLARVKPFVLQETMVPAASLSTPAQVAVERYLSGGRRELYDRIHAYLKWLKSPEGQRVTPEEAHRRFGFLRLRFNAILTQFDMFADAITQRSEHETGVFLAGLDVAAADALKIPGNYYDPPPLICYLDRGAGAAIRRARTRLPGGGENPVAIVRIPRERMIGSGIASSLVHEVGHQAAALMDLVPSLRRALQEMLRRAKERPEAIAWQMFERWISEIVADFWSVARVGVGATLGLMAVVALPRAFVFRIGLDDPHPFPWIRVKISCAMGEALYPHPQWQAIARLWESYYPTGRLDAAQRQVIDSLETELPELVSMLLGHRPKALKGRSLVEAVRPEERSPAKLSQLHRSWTATPRALREVPPTLAFAVLGQARADGRTTPEEESETIASLLRHWAMRAALLGSALVATRGANETQKVAAI